MLLILALNGLEYHSDETFDNNSSTLWFEPHKIHDDDEFVCFISFKQYFSYSNPFMPSVP